MTDIYDKHPELKEWADAPPGETSWRNPERPAAWKTASWLAKLACRLGFHLKVDDGYGWDGGYHCARCGVNWSH